MHTYAILAQAGQGAQTVMTVMPGWYQVVLGFCAFFFLAAVGKGSADLFRKPGEDAPPATLAIQFSRWVPWVLSLVGLVVLLMTLSNTIHDVAIFRPLRPLIVILIVAQAAVTLRAWTTPSVKKVMRIINTLLLVASLITLPVYLAR
ncbi:MAG: hypothetical protein ABI743_03295 [bacterium]